VVKVPGTADKGPVVGAAAQAADDPKKHLQPEEGTLEIGKAEAKAGGEAVAKITVKPGAGYHISTDFPTELKLDPTPGVKLAKDTIGKSDADSLTEQGMLLTVKATPEKPGTYEIKGWFKFGVCDKESCHPKRQPIAIQVAAN